MVAVDPRAMIAACILSRQTARHGHPGRKVISLQGLARATVPQEPANSFRDIPRRLPGHENPSPQCVCPEAEGPSLPEMRLEAEPSEEALPPLPRAGAGSSEEVAATSGLGVGLACRFKSLCDGMLGIRCAS